VISIDPTDTAARLKRIEQLIEEYRAAKHRQLLRRAIKKWRKAEARQRLAEFDVPPERLH
jgi:DNA-binding transcriptional regulator YbjK